MPTPIDILEIRRKKAVEQIAWKVTGASKRVYVGQATCEIAAGANDVWEVFQDAIKSGLKNTYLSAKGCAGLCNMEPMVEIIEKDHLPVKYCRVTREKAQEIIKRHLVEGKVIEEWTLRSAGSPAQ